MGVRPSRYLIYGLVDPCDDELFYIGKTHKRRELRLSEHLATALSGIERPVCHRIRMILQSKETPKIFVLERVPAAASWAEAEKRQIEFWRNLQSRFLPVLWPPMTPKSTPTVISSVSLQNVR